MKCCGSPPVSSINLPINADMPNLADPTIQEKLSQRLSFCEDLGLSPFYRDRQSSGKQISSLPVKPSESTEESPLPKTAAKSSSTPSLAAPKAPVLPVLAVPSLFEATNKTAGDTLPMVRSDLGECTRCKLHKTRNKIVFGDGSANADLVFVGEGPGADEDAQGLPFVGRAGKLLTQMIEAMGLKRPDVYICNVVKCRPPGNRPPEKDEVEACSPFLFRQLDVLQPKVIVCLGATAAQTLLQTNRGISHFRGEWLEYRGFKMMATYHPAYLLRNPAAKSEVWKDLQKVMSELGLEVKKNKAK
jgi:uracil-DNA glycosylase family 4